jgi:hypothetical protein
MSRLGEKWDLWVEDFNSRKPRTALGRYFLGWDDRDHDLGGDDPDALSPLELIWIVATLMLTIVLVEVIDVPDLPEPLEFLAFLGLAVLGGLILGVVRLAWEWLTGSGDPRA